MSRSSVEGEWEAQPADPQSHDLGYDLDNWEQVRARDGDSEKFLYLPEDEELLRKEAFLVVSPEDVENLVDNR